MAANAINNFFGAHSPSLGFGAFGGLGLASSTKPPQLERYHEEHHGWTSKGHSKGKKGNVALSALTLLAFLFFLHILQNCIQEHMQEMKGKYKGNNNGNTTINLPNVIVIDSSSNSNGRNNPKGDDGLLPLSEEDLGQWPIKTHMAQKEAQNRVYKPRAKKTNQKKQQKENKQQQAQHRNAPTPGKNTIQGLAYPIDAADVNIPMHRIDNIP